MDYIYEDGTVAKTVLSVNGVPFPVPAPDSFEIFRQQLTSDSQRTASGKLVTNPIRYGVRKFQLKFNFLAVSEVKGMLGALGNGFWLTVAYLDIDNAWKTITMYHGDISYIPHYILETGLYDGATTTKFNMIQQ